MNAPPRVTDRLSTLAARIGELDTSTVYGRVTAVRGLLVEISGPIGAMSLGGRVLIEIAAGTRVPCEVIGFSGEKALVMPYGGLDGVRRGCPAYVDRHPPGPQTLQWPGSAASSMRSAARSMAGRPCRRATVSMHFAMTRRQPMHADALAPRSISASGR